MIIYNQRDQKWANKIYSATPPHTETLKSSGCGPTSAAMIVSNLTDQTVTPDVMADYSVKNGYRIDGTGTAYGLFPSIAKKYGLDCGQESDINIAIKCVQSGGMAICSTNGGATGLFSTGGHLFVMSGASKDTLEFIDPDLYDGKYNVSYRKYKAKVTAGRVYVQKDIAKLHITTYFCFNKPAQQSITDVTNELLWRGIITNQPLWNAKAEADEDLRWLFVKYYPYMMKNGGNVKSRKLSSDDALAVLQKQNIISDVAKWNNKAYEDKEVYQLIINMADYVN